MRLIQRVGRLNHPVLMLIDRYAGAEEIWRFYRDRAREYHLYNHAKFEHQVVGAKWNDDEGRWTVNIKDLKTGQVMDDSAEVLINCGGALK